MNEGDVILISMPQSDQRDKRRPALVLRRMPKYGDLLVCGISSQVQQAVKDFDIVLARGSQDFAQSGLLSDSVVRLGFLTVIPASVPSGSIGCVSPHTHQALLDRLCTYLKQSTPNQG